MRFPNAYAGVKKIFSSTILSIISGVCSIGMAIVGIIAFAAAIASIGGENAEGAMVGSGIAVIVFMFASGVLSILATIFLLIGLKRAGKDDENFNSGFITAIFVLIFTVVSTALGATNGGNNFYDDIAILIANILRITTTLFVTRGITSLAEQIGDQKMVNIGMRLYLAFSVVLIVSTILQIIGSIIQYNNVVASIAGALLIASAITNIVAFIVYVIYLGKAKKMLKEA